MYLEKRKGGGGGFIGYNKEENLTSNRCGIHIFQKSNITNMRISSRNFSSTKAATPPNALNDAIKLLQC